jgi:hypothetical protein
MSNDKVIVVGPTGTDEIGDTGGDDLESVADAIDDITVAVLRLKYPNYIVRHGTQTSIPVYMHYETVRDVRNEVYLGWCEGDWILESDETPEEIAARLYA